MDPISARPSRPHAAESATLATQRQHARAREREARRPEEFAKPLLPQREGPSEGTGATAERLAGLPLIAVSAGLPRGPDLVPDPEEVLRRQLADRAELIDVSPVLAQATAPAAPSPAQPTSTGHGSAQAAREAGDPLPRGRSPEEPLPLLGDGRTLEDSDTGQARSEAPVRPAPRRLPSEREQQRLQRSDRQRAERSSDPRSLERMSTLGPQAGSVQPREAARDEPGAAGRGAQPDRLPGEEVARRELTQAGIVEARQSRDLFARFLAGTPARDPGPVPRPREVLGIRSRPISVKV